MSIEYPFVGRESELKDLQRSFAEKVLHQRGSVAYLVQGRPGIGKTRLVKEFMKSIHTDVLLHSEIPEFDEQKHVITYDCAESEGKPYEPFERITNEMVKQQKLRFVLSETILLILSVFNIDTTITHIKVIFGSLFGKPKEQGVTADEARRFNRYRRLIAGSNRKAPLFIFIQNANQLDVYSLKLLEKLLYDHNPFWGVIILEEEQHAIDNEIQEALNRMVGEGKISRVVLWNLGKEFPARLLGSAFKEGLFDGSELDVMYAISEGCPGILIDQLEAWKKNGWIEKGREGWSKCGDFKEKIKPKFQKLLELVIALFEDNQLTESEERMINRMSAEWGIPQETVLRTIDMVRDIYSCKFKIVRRIGPGIIGQESFEAVDDNHKTWLIEYIRNEQNVAIIPRRREIEHANLFEAREVRVGACGVLVCWDYRDGRRIREIMREARETQVKRTLDMLKQITPALCELHRVGEVHGFIQPESIIETSKGNFCLASFDPSLVRLLPAASRPGREFLNYVAPEVLSGGNGDARSDIYSMGVLLYNLLTNRFPFEGSKKEDLLEAIQRQSLTFTDEIVLSIPKDLQPILKKSLDFYPENRYPNAGEFLADLRKVSIDDEPIVEPPPAPPVSSAPWRKLAAVISLVVFVVFVSVIAWKKVVKPARAVNAITISIVGGENSAKVRKALSGRAVQYLIRDDLMQSSNLQVLLESQFARVYPSSGSVPRLAVKGEIASGDLQYELRLKFVSSDVGTQETTYTFHEPSALLSDLSKITEKILGQVNAIPLRHSTFTQNWDSFESFYQAEIAWRRLSADSADQGFREALDIDSTFVLAMVRLADVKRFNGQRAEALGLLQQALPHVGELGIADSLRVQALRCRLTGHLWEAVDIYKQIVNLLPGTRTPVYDLAEAYYELREITQAVEQYRLALLIDNTFSPAYNHLGYCYSHLGMHDSALVCFRKYVALDSSANAFDSWADGYFAAGYLDSAAWAKEQGIRLDPRIGYLYSALAFISIRAGQFSKAQDCIKRYLEYAGTHRELRSTGLCAQAYWHYVKNDFVNCAEVCRSAIQEFDSDNLASRNHQLHWLLALASLQTGYPEVAATELSKMKSMIVENKVNPKHYNEIYKFAIHLEAAMEAAKGNVESVKAAIAAFDGPLKSKVKDGGSPFDLAYLNTSLGKMLMDSRINASQLAEGRFKAALDFNPRFAGAHYWLGRLYDSTQKPDAARRELAVFVEEWHGADAEALKNRMIE